MLVAFLVITGFYPLTQLYQREQDIRRGDISFAVRWGERCFPLAMACFLSGAAVLGFLAWRNFGPAATVLAVVGPLVLATYIGWWWNRYDESQMRLNYVRVMRLGYLQTVGFLGFIVWQMLG
jgi:1,4-dihydroxy-2-naphthoate octaprenyltransferase